MHALRIRVRPFKAAIQNRTFSWAAKGSALVKKAKKPIKRRLETPKPRVTKEQAAPRWRFLTGLGPKLGILGFSSAIGGMVLYGWSLEASYVDDTDKGSPRRANNPQHFAKMIRSLMAQTYGWFATGLLVTGATALWVTRPFLLPHFLKIAPFDVIGGGLIGGFMAYVAALFWGRDWVNSRVVIFTMFHAIMGLWILGWWLLTATTFHQTMVTTWCSFTSMALVAASAPNEDYLRNMTLFAVLLGLGLGGCINSLFFITDTLTGELLCYSIAGFGGAYLSLTTADVLRHAKTAMIFDPMFFALIAYMPNVRLDRWLRGGQAYDPAPTPIPA